MEKLISMTDFALGFGKEENRCNYEQAYDRISNYANFLKQPLEIWQFVPCKLVDVIWVVLEEINEEYPNNIEYFDEIKEYQEAKDRVLFLNNDFKYFEKYKILEIKGKHEYSLRMFETRTIEDLVKYNLELTPTALKQIGL